MISQSSSFDGQLSKSWGIRILLAATFADESNWKVKELGEIIWNTILVCLALRRDRGPFPPLASRSTVGESTLNLSKAIQDRLRGLHPHSLWFAAESAEAKEV